MEGPNKQMASSGKQLICLMKNKISWVTFNIFTDLRLQEGPQCGVVTLVVATGVMREEDILDDKVMDLGH